jgi:hypothetical protein
VTNSLSGLRLAITLPPVQYFGGIDRVRARDTAVALRALGAVVFEFETDAAYRGDRAMVAQQIEDLRAFRADAVVAACQAGYAFEALWPDDRDRWGNIFLDLLELPIICYWDHVVPQLPRFVLSHWPRNSQESVDGVLDRMQALIAHPRTAHFVPDTGHIARLIEMGISGLSAANFFVTSIPAAYISFGDRAVEPIGQVDAAFFGNIYLAATREIGQHLPHPLLGVRDRAIAMVGADWSRAPFDAYVQAIELLDDDLKVRYCLDPDQSFYWRFLFDELSIVAYGNLRLQKLRAGNRPMHYFGGFSDPLTRNLLQAPWWLVRESLPYGDALAAQYRNTRVAVDIANGPFINGFSPKLFECFASGGFMLTSRQADISAAIGDELAGMIVFSGPDELSAKVDHFLTRDRERGEISREIRSIIRSQHTASTLLARTIPQALELIRAR